MITSFSICRMFYAPRIKTTWPVLQTLFAIRAGYIFEDTYAEVDTVTLNNIIYLRGIFLPFTYPIAFGCRRGAVNFLKCVFHLRCKGRVNIKNVVYV